MKGSNEMTLQAIILIGILTLAITMPIIFQKSLAQNSTMGNTSFSLYTNASKPSGLTYGEWTAKWWQWAYSVPRNVNPSYDDSGLYCSEGQNGPVWFLTSSYKHQVALQTTCEQDTQAICLSIFGTSSYISRCWE